MKRILFLFLFGTTVFLVLVQFTAIGFWLSSIAGIAALTLTRVIMRFFDRHREKAAVAAIPGKKEADEAVRDGMAKIRSMSNKTRMIPNNEVAAKIKEICKTGVKIFDDIKKNPEDLRRARQFLNYYLDTTSKIINQYVELSNKREITPEVDTTLERIEGMLDSIKTTFDRQLANMLEDDLLNLDTEIKVLKRTMKMEG